MFRPSTGVEFRLPVFSLVRPTPDGRCVAHYERAEHRDDDQDAVHLLDMQTGETTETFSAPGELGSVSLMWLR